MGWLGTWDELEHTLRVVGADRDGDGKFLVAGPPNSIVSFLGMGEEYAVDDTAVYYKGGKPMNLAGLLNATSYGIRGIKVI